MRETIKFIPDKKREEKIKKFLKDGYRWRCLGCGLVSKDKRQEFYEDGHGGRFIDMCRCGSDLFIKLEDMSCKIVKVQPVNGTLVFKEHHFKYCKCDKGEVWTGEAET